ncbi:MAG: PKD domain-containing protein [Thermoplasmata archaeon]|nr:PKD domain-containing protein [Thermoplasmata archaeon]
MAPRSRGGLPVVVALVTLLALTAVVLPPAGAARTPGTPLAQNATPPLAHPGAVVVARGYAPPLGVENLGPLPAAAPLTVLVSLPSRDASGFQAYETSAYIPGSGAFHHYLTPQGIAARYGPSHASVVASQNYFRGHGLAVTQSADGLLVSVSGPAAAVAGAFGTNFAQYRAADGRVFFSHSIAASLPADLGIAGVYGLGNVTPLAPVGFHARSSPPLAGPAAGCTTGPAGLSPCQIWGAYDMAGLISNGTNGAGERIAVVDAYDAGEPETQLASDLASFDGLFGLPTPVVSYNYPVPTQVALNSTFTGWSAEEALDLEWSHASAPGASLAMTFAPNAGVGLYLAVDWIVSYHLADVISLSWGEPDVGLYNAYSGACVTECNATSDGSYEILSPVLAAAAVEGISVFVASGDCGSADGTSGVSTDYPASDPSVTGVGGTYLSVNATGVYQSEVAWSGNSSGASSPGCQNGGGSGGGYSPFPRPYWQAGTGVPSSPATRGVPDVSQDAVNGVTIVLGGGEGGVGGTSLSTPIWAGIAAISDQYAGHALGLLDPALYSIFRATNYSTDFHDITSGNNGYAAGTGWDPITGIGSPIVGQMVRDLARPSLPVTTLSAALYANVLYGAAPLTVRFAIAPAGGSGTYPLEGVYFGDGTSGLASGGSVSHTFSVAGVFVTMGFVADSSGNLTVSDPLAIVVGGGGPLNVTLTPSTSSPAVGLGVTFTTTVQGGTSPYKYVYSFGDGTFLNLSSAAATVHSYSTARGYCADVVAEDSGHPVDGARSTPVAIAVGGAATPVCSNASAAFRLSAETAPAIRDAPADFPSLFQLSGGVLDPGNTGATYAYSSSDPYPVACSCTIFRAAGTYNISLTATDLIGDQASNETNVTVAPPLVGAFWTTTTYGSAPLTVQFHANVTGGYLSNANLTVWNYGDGATSVGNYVTHVYTTPGYYSATGDVSDRGFGNASEGFLIDVLPSGGSNVPALTASFAPAVNVSSGTTVHFASGSNESGMNFSWDLGENGSAWGPRATQTYYTGVTGVRPELSVGLTAAWGSTSQNVSLTLRSPQLFATEAGAFVPRTNDLHLSEYSSTPGGLPGFVWHGSAALSAPGSGTVGWAFGDGGTASGPTTRHVFPSSGLYDVNVSGSDSWGDSASGELGVLVSAAPPLTVQGGPSTERGPVPLSVDFTAQGAGGSLPYSFQWETGDGAIAINATFTHVYDTAGNFTASLTVRDGGTDLVLQNWTIVVLNTPPPTHLTTHSSPSPLAEYALVGGVVAALVAGILARRGRGSNASRVTP